MARGDRIIVGVQSGRLYEQEGSTFTENQWGFDDGVRKFLTHPQTSKSLWPQRNQADAEWRNMYVTDVVERKDESGLIELIAFYRGVMRFTSKAMKERILPGADVSMFNLPSKTGGGQKVNYVATVPKPNVSREYLTLTKPTLTGVGFGIDQIWLPKTPAFTVSYNPDPDEAQTLNLIVGWVLDDRSWQDISGKVYLVREDAGFYYPLAG